MGYDIRADTRNDSGPSFETQRGARIFTSIIIGPFFGLVLVFIFYFFPKPNFLWSSSTNCDSRQSYSTSTVSVFKTTTVSASNDNDEITIDDILGSLSPSTTTVSDNFIAPTNPEFSSWSQNKLKDSPFSSTSYCFVNLWDRRSDSIFSLSSDVSFAIFSFWFIFSFLFFSLSELFNTSFIKEIAIRLINLLPKTKNGTWPYN